MNTNLTVLDPLVEQEVKILITLLSSEKPREERPVLVSVGVAEQAPMIKTGTFNELTDLIHDAWTAFGVRAQIVDVVASETAVEAQIVATALVDDPEATVQVKQAAPKPQAKNLSLF